MKFQQALRRIARLSPKKKAAAAAFAVLLALVVVAAYARNPWLLGLLVLVFAAALAVGALYVDRLLKASRRATKRASRGAGKAGSGSGPTSRGSRRVGCPLPDPGGTACAAFDQAAFR